MFFTRLEEAIVYTEIWKEGRGDSSSQDHVVKESITCRPELADLDARIIIGFLQIAPADKDKGYNQRQDRM